jgi:hypothetical protein
MIAPSNQALIIRDSEGEYYVIPLGAIEQGASPQSTRPHWSVLWRTRPLATGFRGRGHPGVRQARRGISLALRTFA